MFDWRVAVRGRRLRGVLPPTITRFAHSHPVHKVGEFINLWNAAPPTPTRTGLGAIVAAFGGRGRAGCCCCCCCCRCVVLQLRVPWWGGRVPGWLVTINLTPLADAVCDWKAVEGFMGKFSARIVLHMMQKKKKYERKECSFFFVPTPVGRLFGRSAVGCKLSSKFDCKFELLCYGSSKVVNDCGRDNGQEKVLKIGLVSTFLSCALKKLMNDISNNLS